MNLTPWSDVCLFEKGHPVQQKIKFVYTTSFNIYINFNPFSLGIKISRFGFLIIFFKNVLFINERNF